VGDFLKNTELKAAFESMSPEQLSSVDHLADFIFNRVGLALRVGKLRIAGHHEMKCWGGMKCRQFPDELAQMLVFLYWNRKKINSYCEIGVCYGGTFYVVDSFLRAVNPDMGQSLAIDVNEHRVMRSGFVEYKANNPEVDFLRVSSKYFKPDRKYDLCFIDGDHSYEACMADYRLMKNYSNMIALHDVKLPYREVKNVWDEIDGHYKIEFVTRDNRLPIPMGIGILLGGA
jgi:hypothetical protein